ncbi:MAG: TadE family protein [Bryobacteraceae bacterium]
MITKARKSRGLPERGSAMVEFVLCVGLFLVPLLLGTMVMGLNLVRAIQVTGVCRDAAHMYAYGVDFSQTGNQNLLLKVAQGLNMTATGGNGIVILSTVTFIGPNDCTTGGYSSSTCPNVNQYVITQRTTVGNTALHASAFATPSSSLLASNGTISGGSPTQAGYLNDSSTRAVGFSNVMTLSSGQYAYMAETFVTSPDYSWWSKLGTAGSSARSIF